MRLDRPVRVGHDGGEKGRDTSPAMRDIIIQPMGPFTYFIATSIVEMYNKHLRVGAVLHDYGTHPNTSQR